MIINIHPSILHFRPIRPARELTRFTIQLRGGPTVGPTTTRTIHPLPLLDVPLANPNPRITQSLPFEAPRAGSLALVLIPASVIASPLQGFPIGVPIPVFLPITDIQTSHRHHIKQKTKRKT
ncbi:hypothetical protein QJS10_CPA16g00222 [Acorus calamus]|uniref:Uncharacterized protein n=1 Tax=Acorus calamus TaxID=4465 RepID=A0AAV9D2K0_ACOCL|nr:hypothetical protein QJS10_CPA16g00222 [Acorus calamus]